MNKKEFQDKYLEDFEKIRGALLSQIANNSKLSETLMENFAKEDFRLLDEHTSLSKIILDSSKVLSEVYKLAPQIIDSIQESKGESKKMNLDELLEEEGEG